MKEKKSFLFKFILATSKFILLSLATGRKDAISENAGSTEMEKRHKSANNGPLLNLN